MKTLVLLFLGLASIAKGAEAIAVNTNSEIVGKQIGEPIPVDNIISALRKKGCYIVNIRQNGEQRSIPQAIVGTDSLRNMSFEHLMKVLLNAEQVMTRISHVNQLVVSPRSGLGLLDTEVKKIVLGKLTLKNAILELSKSTGIALMVVMSDPQAGKEISAADFSKVSLFDCLNQLISPISKKGWSATLTGLTDGLRPSVIIQIQ